MYTYRNPYGPVTSQAYRSDLNVMQALLVRVNLEGALSRLRRYRPVDIINAIAYVLKTGCQWPMLPLHFPKWKTVYRHFRSLSDRGWFRTFLRSIPIQGRWVVERTFSWMDNYRRLTRGYERLLKVAAHMFRQSLENTLPLH